MKKQAPRGGKKPVMHAGQRKMVKGTIDYKKHVKVDAKSKMFTDFETTATSVHDSQIFKELVDEKDDAVLADSAY